MPGCGDAPHHFSPARLLLPAELLLTPEQFELVCAENREAVLELPPDGHLIAMKPSGGETSERNSRLVMRLMLSADLRGPRHPGLQLQLAEIWAG